MEQQLVNLIVERTGISQEQAYMAVQVMAGFLKDRLPGPIGSHLDLLLGSPNEAAYQQQQQQQQGGLGMLGGMLGNR